VVIEAVRQTRIILGVAVDSLGADPAWPFPLGRPRAVIHDKQIQLAVVVIVEPAGGDRPGFTGAVCAESRSSRDVLERPVAPVAVQKIAVYTRDKQILPPVVVIVRDGDPRRESRAGYARGGRHIGEGSIAVVPVQA